jgi:hypothetical protein
MGLLVGTEAMPPAASTAVRSSTQTQTAAQRLVNDPRLSGVISESVAVGFQGLKAGSSDLNPPPLSRPAASAAGSTAAATDNVWTTPNHPVVFNNDVSGLPQNEEAVSSCSGGTDVVGDWNDYRNAASYGDITGWGISTDSAQQLLNSNFLPGVSISGVTSGPGSGYGSGVGSGTGTVYVPSYGDPMIQATSSCAVYASSLGIQPNVYEPYASGVVVARSTVATLSTCSKETSCWPQETAVVMTTDPNILYDKDSMAVDTSGPNGAVWVGFTQYDYDNGTVNLQVSRCGADLKTCSAPMTLQSESLYTPNVVEVPTFSGIAIDATGDVYVSWGLVIESSAGSGFQQSMDVYVATAQPKSLRFGPPVLVSQVEDALLNPMAAESFRINGFPEIAVTGSGPHHVDIVYAECGTLMGTEDICENSHVFLASSATAAIGTWTVKEIDPSTTGSDFFPTITTDQVTGTLLLGFWTTRYDPNLHSFDVVAVPVNPATGAVGNPIRVTPTSIEPDSDSMLGPSFIGGYSQLNAVNGTAYAHYTSTQRLQRLLGQGIPIPQQDNVISKFTFTTP